VRPRKKSSDRKRLSGITDALVFSFVALTTVGLSSVTTKVLLMLSSATPFSVCSVLSVVRILFGLGKPIVASLNGLLPNREMRRRIPP